MTTGGPAGEMGQLTVAIPPPLPRAPPSKAKPMVARFLLRHEIPTNLMYRSCFPFGSFSGSNPLW